MSIISRLSSLAPVFLVALCALPTIAHGSSPTLTFSNQEGPIQSLEIGDDFFVSASGLTPGQIVTFTLYDDFNVGVSRQSAKADSQGHIEQLSLWPWSGVVGCDADSNPNPVAYSFIDFDEAASILQNRVFSVVLHENDNVLASRTLPLVDTRQPRHFYSDAMGCPRLTFDRDLGEDIYLTVQNVDLTQQNMAVFLVSAFEPFGPNMEILEVRMPFQGTPQVAPPSSGSDLTMLLWSYRDAVPGPYVAILHFFKGLPNQYQQPGNISLAPDRGHPGVTVVPFDCRHCDPPD